MACPLCRPAAAATFDANSRILSLPLALTLTAWPKVPLASATFAYNVPVKAKAVASSVTVA